LCQENKQTITIKTTTIMATTIKDATLYNNYGYNVEDYRDAYIDHCDDLGINVEDEIPVDFIEDMLDEDWFDLFENLYINNIYNDECVVIGTLGLWSGRKQIIPTREDTLAVAIKHCCHNCDLNIIKIIDGHIEITSTHHDGNNHFEIYLLNRKGQNTLEADLTKSCYHRKIKDDFWK
jgi:hypothetical protein